MLALDGRIIGDVELPPKTDAAEVSKCYDIKDSRDKLSLLGIDFRLDLN